MRRGARPLRPASKVTESAGWASASLTCDSSSTSIRWRPSLATLVVTHLVTRLPHVPEHLQGFRPENARLKKIAQLSCVHVVTGLPPELFADLLNHRGAGDDQAQRPGRRRCLYTPQVIDDVTLERVLRQVEQDVCLVRRATFAQQITLQGHGEFHWQASGQVPCLPYLAIGEDHPLDALVDGVHLDLPQGLDAQLGRAAVA